MNGSVLYRRKVEKVSCIDVLHLVRNTSKRRNNLLYPLEMLYIYLVQRCTMVFILAIVYRERKQ
jgi:hypothetical protein